MARSATRRNQAGPEDRAEQAVPEALQALAVFLERESQVLEGRSRGLFLRAAFHPVLHELGGLHLTCQQTFRPDHDRLAAEGLAVTLEPGPRGFDLCLYLGTRQRDENLYNFARGLDLLGPGGLFLCSLPNDLGAGRFERLLGEAAPVEITFSKHHSRVFGAFRDDRVDGGRLARWLDLGAYRPSSRSGLLTCPGIFGWDKVDEGSRLLADSLPAEMPGVGADLGAGYGYLGHRIRQGVSGVRGLHLFEAEHLALEAARRNLEGWGAARFHWQDVTAGLPRDTFDWIVMNAPFHEGRTRSLELGERFVAAAAEALRPGGALHMVANRHLPYEAALEDRFARVERGPEREGFKVLRAWR